MLCSATFIFTKVKHWTTVLMARPRINICIPVKYLSRKNKGRFGWAGRPETARRCHGAPGADTASAMAKTRKGLSQRSPSSPLRSTSLVTRPERRTEVLKREPAAGILHRRRRAMPPELPRLCQFIACFPGLTVVEVGKAETAPSPRMCVIVHCPSGTKARLVPVGNTGRDRVARARFRETSE